MRAPASSFLLLLLAALLGLGACAPEHTAVEAQQELFTIVGKVHLRLDEQDLAQTRVLVDDGAFVGFLRADGTFTISGVPSASYVLEVSSPRNVYEAVRVDVNAKGKMRARRLNLLEPGDVQTLRYPVSFESKGLPAYFFKREQFRVLDILMSPMVLMMVVPLLLVLVLPKLVNQDPELQKELAATTSMFQPNQANMPDLTNMLNRYLPGGAPGPTADKKKAARGEGRKKT